MQETTELLYDMVKEINKDVKEIKNSMITKESCIANQKNLKEGLNYKQTIIICSTISGSIVAIFEGLKNIL